MLDIYLTMKATKKSTAKKISLEQVMKALGDPIRLSVVRQLLATDNKEMPCCDFKHGVTKATFSHHMDILREAEIVQSRHEGTRKMTSLKSDTLDARFPGLLELVAKK